MMKTFDERTVFMTCLIKGSMFTLLRHKMEKDRGPVEERIIQ